MRKLSIVDIALLLAATSAVADLQTFSLEINNVATSAVSVGASSASNGPIKGKLISLSVDLDSRSTNDVSIQLKTIQGRGSSFVAAKTILAETVVSADTNIDLRPLDLVLVQDYLELVGGLSTATARQDSVTIKLFFEKEGYPSTEGQTLTIQGTGSDAPATSRVTVAGHEGNLNAHPTVDYEHEKTHEGMSFEISSFTEEVADDAFLRFLIIPATNRQFHGQYIVSCEGAALVEIHYNVNPTNNGTAITPVNRFFSSTNEPGGSFFSQPQFGATTGTIAHIQFLPGGGGPNSSGGSAASRNEYILNDGITNVLLSVKNIAGSAKAISAEALFYREDE